MRPARVPDGFADRPFTLAEAAAAGLTPAMLRGPTWRRLLRGVYAHAGVPDTRELRVRAVALLVEQPLFVIGPTAAWLYGVDIAAERIWVGSDLDNRPRPRPEWRLRAITPGPEDLSRLDGVGVTSPLRTSLDCARWLPVTTAVIVADALGYAGWYTAEQFASYVARHRRLRGIVRARRLVSLVDPRAESPQETRLRLLLVMEGLSPVPQLQVWDGEVLVARLDLAFPDEKVAVEYDGRQHFLTVAADERRRAWLRDLGWSVIVVYAEDLATPAARAQLVARVRRELARRGRRPAWLASTAT